MLTAFLGDSAAEFIAIKATPTMIKKFSKLEKAVYHPDGPAFVVLNDELSDRVTEIQLKNVDRYMKDWMGAVWPEKVRVLVLS